MKPQAKAQPGRPALLASARPSNVVLDEESRAIALQLGEGNLSAGIRKALKLAKESSS